MKSRREPAHRKPRRRPITVSTARTAATIAGAVAAAATGMATASGQPGQADAPPTAREVKERVDRLYQEAEQATERYNAAKERAGHTREHLDELQDEIARKTAKLNTVRRRLGPVATAQYRSGGAADPTMRLALSSDPGQYLDRAGLMDRMGSRQVQALRACAEANRSIAQDRAEAAGQLAELKRAQRELAEQKQGVTSRLTRAQRLLSRLNAAGRAQFGAGTGGTGARAGRGAGAHGRVGVDLGGIAAPSARAARAIAFAHGALGKPYVWGATGPNAFDCSGLTQAAWRAAGVSLPRTTYSQIDAGARIGMSALQPGDLVFFYASVSHVGIYVGGGQMIHAPRPGTAVRIAPIDQMPFAGAVRPA